MRLPLLFIFCFMSASLVADSAYPQTEEIETRVKRLESLLQSQAKQLAYLQAELERQTIYDSLAISNARVEGGPFSPGDKITIVYDLKNTSSSDLAVPVDRSYSRPYRVVGTRQHWIERVGKDKTIDGIPKQIGRRGAQYSAGGQLIMTKATIAAGESFKLTRTVSTTGYPAGKYTFYIEYKKTRGELLQTKGVTFTLGDKTADKAGNQKARTVAELEPKSNATGMASSSDGDGCCVPCKTETPNVLEPVTVIIDSLVGLFDSQHR
jgi:hypothetical protein